MLGMFAPKQLWKEQIEDNKQLNQGPSTEEESSAVLCRAFWSSLALVVASCVVGVIVAHFISKFGPMNPKIILGFQAAGALLLLWGTLFVRGWDIQTHAGVTLVERVNQWIYRTLYCLGTAIFIFSVALP